MELIYFLILIGVLIFIHEFGHFFFAKFFDVKVERFAIGMGPVLGPLSFRRGETEYAICSLPIGGYVKMFGMQPEELYDEYGQEVSEEEASRAFVRQPIWQRFIIVLAGPAMNLIFPIFVYFFFALGTGQMTPAMVGQVFPDAPAARAQATSADAPPGLQAGDTILAIDGEEVRYWRDLTDHVRDAIGQPLEVKVRRGDRELTYKVVPEAYTKTDRLGLTRETYGLIGVSVESYGPIIAIRDDGSPAAKAGLKTFDHVLGVDGERIKRFVELTDAARTSGGEPLELAVARPVEVGILGGGMRLGDTRTVSVSPVQRGGEWTLGVEPAQLFLASVEEEGPAAKAGLKVGDKVTSMAICGSGEDAAKDCKEPEPYNNIRSLKLDIQQQIWQKMHEKSDADPSSIRITFKLTYMRGGEEHEVAYTPIVRQIEGSFNEPVPEIWFGFDTYGTYELPEPIPVPFFDRLSLGVEQGFGQTWRFTSMMINGIVHLVQGRVSTDTVGGPIMIFDIAGRAGKAGWESFLRMMALISINLGLVNLLPIPLLDGGHLMLFTIEAIKRKELNARTRQIAYYVGLGIIVLLMLLAFKNDIERYWQDFAEWFNA